MQPITEAEFLMVIKKDNKMKEIHQIFRNIDSDRSSYLTNTELDDVLKMMYPNDFENKNLEPLYTNYLSQQNRSMINHKKFE